MKNKIIGIFILGSMLGNMAFSAGVRDVIERNNSVIENQRKQEELERRQRELEKENFGKEVKPVETDQVEDSNVRFFITKIELSDDYRLLSKGEIKKITDKYVNRKLNSKDINKLLSDFYNKYIEKGYITTRVKLDDKQNLSDGIIRIITMETKVQEETELNLI